MDDKLDTAMLLARFKLLVKRQLAETVDLDRLTREADYARLRLAEIEEKADNEELLVMLLKVRERLRTQPPTADAESGAASTVPVRDYKFGARSW